jgi:hypothetical protein
VAQNEGYVLLLESRAGARMPASYWLGSGRESWEIGLAPRMAWWYRRGAVLLAGLELFDEGCCCRVEVTEMHECGRVWSSEKQRA